MTDSGTHGQPKTWEVMRILLRRYPRRSALVFVCLLVAGIFEGVGLLALLPVLRIASGERDAEDEGAVRDLFGIIGLEPTLGVLLIAVVLLISMKAALSLLAMSYVGSVNALLAAELRASVIRALMKARWGFFVKNSIGGMVNSVVIESRESTSAYRATCQLFAGLMQVVVFLVAASLISPILTGLGFVAGCVIMAVLAGFVSMARRAGQRCAELTRSLNGRMTDALQGFKPLKAMGQERFLLPLLSHENAGLQWTMHRQVIAKYGLSLLREPVIMFFLAAGIYVSFTWASIPISELLVMAVLFQRTANSLSIAQQSYQQVGVSQAYFWSLKSLIERSEQAEETPSGTRTPVLERSLKFECVDFAYGARKVLDDFSCEIKAGQMLALVGPSGSGKTTIADLTCRLLDPDSGRIILDGVDLAEIDKQAWREKIGYVPQELFLFHDTVRANITLGDLGIPDDDVVRALEAAEAWGFVQELPDGLDEVIGERGIRLSGGQRQRLAIARALVRKPLLLVLDESTTALDPEAEKGILQTLRRLGGKVTILAISHQTGVVSAADQVIRLEPKV